MKLIIGLGNPGKHYIATRHNIGFLALDTLQKTFGGQTFQNKARFHAEVAECFITSHRVQLIKPQTFMNRSGETVASMLRFYKLSHKDIIVLHDDIDLLWGKLKYTNDSRSAGHRGVQNIIDSLGTQKFSRLRIGMGPRPENIPTEKFVLAPFTKQEVQDLPTLLTTLTTTLPEYLK